MSIRNSGMENAGLRGQNLDLENDLPWQIAHLPEKVGDIVPSGTCIADRRSPEEILLAIKIDTKADVHRGTCVVRPTDPNPDAFQYPQAA